MLLERGDVDPDQADTKYGRTPLAWAAEFGHAEVVKMLSERKDVRTATPVSKNQTPLSRALPEGHDRVASALLELDTVNSDTADHAGRTSPPASVGHGNKCLVGLQFRGRDPDTHITDVSGQHAPLLADPNQPEPVPDPKDSHSMSTDSDSSIAQPALEQPPPRRLLRFWYLHRKAHTHPNTTRSILSLTVDRYFAIASFFCLLAFLVYFLRSSLPEILPLH
ncbi:hypothetical protein HOY80DRAFT_986632, partial [Tuber brumale]